MTWPVVDADTLMWVQVATGFTGGLTLVYLWRTLFGRGHSVEGQAYFSPRGGCQEALVQLLQQAQSEILVQAYAFAAEPLISALAEAKKRGVLVEILLDRSNQTERYADLHALAEKDLTPLIDAEHAIAHDKIVIIDQSVIVTGSYNFTQQAEQDNAENMLMLKGHPELARQYRDNFMKHKAHCKPAQVREDKNRRAA